MLTKSLSAQVRRVGDLIVVLQERHESVRGQTASGRAAPLALPRVPLALIEKAPLCGRQTLARSGSLVIGLAPAGQRDHGGVVKVVIPQRIESTPP